MSEVHCTSHHCPLLERPVPGAARLMLFESARSPCWFNRTPSSSMSARFLSIVQRTLWTWFARMATIPTQQTKSLVSAPANHLRSGRDKRLARKNSKRRYDHGVTAATGV